MKDNDCKDEVKLSTEDVADLVLWSAGGNGEERTVPMLA